MATNTWGTGVGYEPYDGVTIDTGTLPGSYYLGYNLGMNLVHETGHWWAIAHHDSSATCIYPTQCHRDITPGLAIRRARVQRNCHMPDEQVYLAETHFADALTSSISGFVQAGAQSPFCWRLLRGATHALFVSTGCTSVF